MDSIKALRFDYEKEEPTQTNLQSRNPFLEVLSEMQSRSALRAEVGKNSPGMMRTEDHVCKCAVPRTVSISDQCAARHCIFCGKEWIAGVSSPEPTLQDVSEALRRVRLNQPRVTLKEAQDQARRCALAKKKQRELGLLPPVK